MSGALRSQANRSRSRNAIASPYARPRQQKKSSWSITGLIGYLNPFASRPSPERSPSPTLPPESPSSDNEDATDLPQAAHTLSSRGHEMAANLNTISQKDNVPAPPISPVPQTKTHIASPSLFHQSESPVKNLETVSAFLNSKVGQPITPIEMEGVLSLLQRSAPQDGPTPFRFESRSPSATPARGISPFVPTPTFKFSTPEPTVNPTPAVTTRRTLSKNPNGVYRWQGGGSARTSRTRNRFSSPAFGPSQTSSGRIVLKDNGVTEPPKTDAKRRRVGEDASSSFSAPAGVEKNAFPPTSTPAATTTVSPHTLKPSIPTSSTARLRIPALQKPTTPAVPSPLRQAWSEGSSSSDLSQSQTSKPSKAANFMTELIKEATPPKKPDVSNPYQTANPVAKLAPRRPIRRTRAAVRKEKEAAEKKKEEKDAKEVEHISAQAIIEATVPKGSKRSRPPSHFEKSPEKSALSEEAENDEEDLHVNKKSKSAVNGNGSSVSNSFYKTASASPPNATTDVDMESSDEGNSSKLNGKTSPTPSPSLPSTNASTSTPLSPPGNRGLLGNYKASSIPKEPSKLRFSVVVDGSSNPTQPSVPIAPLVPVNAPAPAEQTDMVDANAKTDLKETARLLKTSSLPSFDFPTSGASTASVTFGSNFKPKDVASLRAADSLPTFTFTINGTSVFPSSPEHEKARAQVRSMSKPFLPTFDFSADALKKETISVSTSVSSPTPAPTTGFNWAAAGVKPPPAPSTDSWTCSVCMITNAASKDICAACEAPGPSASKPSPAPSTGFNWAAAGMKPPTSDTGSWTCSVCMISNSNSKDICAACDSPS